jgi:hypothetical protein
MPSPTPWKYPLAPSCILAHEKRYPPYAETTAHRLVNLNMVLSTYYRLWRMIRPSTWPWRSIAHHLGLQHHITISGNRGQRSREDLLWGAVGSIPGNRRNRRAIRVKHIGTLPLNPYCGLQLLKKHGNLSEWENSARSLPLGARRFPPDSKHLSISHSKVSCSADRQNDRLNLTASSRGQNMRGTILPHI